MPSIIGEFLVPINRAESSFDNNEELKRGCDEEVHEMEL
jgi:hypothetical protein